MKKQLLASLLTFACCLMVQADRYQSLLNARHITVTTQNGDTYYYIATSEKGATTRLQGDRIVIEGDEYTLSDLKGIRIENISRFVLDEDAATFDKNSTADHALLALRKTLNVNKWNPIILPVELTGEQVRDAFGEDAQVARVRGFRPGENTVVEYETIDLDTREVSMLPNVHYIIRPTREPDLSEGKTAPAFGDMRPAGPLYLIPTVSLSKGQSPETEYLISDDNTVRLKLAGTYVMKDGSSSNNKKVPSGAWLLGDNGLFGQSEEEMTVKAFSSWYAFLGTEKPALHFYIDGIDEDLSEQFQGLVSAKSTTEQLPQAVYDLQGRRMNSSLSTSHSSLRKGIYIINGKKTIIK